MKIKSFKNGWGAEETQKEDGSILIERSNLLFKTCGEITKNNNEFEISVFRTDHHFDREKILVTTTRALSLDRARIDASWMCDRAFYAE